MLSTLLLTVLTNLGMAPPGVKSWGSSHEPAACSTAAGAVGAVGEAGADGVGAAGITPL